MKKKLFHKITALTLTRRIIQIASLILFPGLFLYSFAAMKSIYVALISGTFNGPALTGQLVLTISLLIITVSFLPIFTLESQEGRLFGPLAFTKTFSMAAAALLSVTLVPALMILFVRGYIVPEHKIKICLYELSFFHFTKSRMRSHDLLCHCHSHSNRLISI